MLEPIEIKQIKDLIRKSMCCLAASTPAASTLQLVTDAGNTTTNDIILNVGASDYVKLWNDAGDPLLRIKQGTAIANYTPTNIQYFQDVLSLSILPTTLTASRTINIPDLSGTLALMDADNLGNFTLDGALYLKPGTTDRYKIWYDDANAALRFDGNYTIFSNENGFASFFFRDAVNGIFMTMAGGAVGIGNFANNGYKFEVTGSTKSSGRFQTALGANVASANNLTLGTDGNVFHITGTTTINAITTASWSSGSEITLIFDSTPTVKNNTAGGAGTAKIFITGGADFVATANSVLRLTYDGTSWFGK